jgi:hypothetical protein
VATASRECNVAGFPAIRAVIEAVGTKTDVVLSLANGTVPLAGTALFGHIALHADGRTFHGCPLENCT